MITKATSPGYLYAVTTDSTCIITDVDTRYNLCKAVANKQGMFAAIGGSVECSDDNVMLTQTSAVSGGTRFEVVTTRPDAGEVGVIYLVPAANSTTENLYEEWVWIDDKWEQIGSAGLNLSNYAQLTTANTFSADNTFNGNLIKKTSNSLADNSVLNRSEMDSRYGLKSTTNTWTDTNTFTNIETSRIRCLHAFAFENVNMNGKHLDMEVSTGINMLSSEIKLLSHDIVIGNSPSNGKTTKISIVGELSVTQGALRVLSQNGIKVMHELSVPARVTIAPSGLEAFPLNQDVFGENKYGIRITDTSCQLFGIDFNYGDVWSETNDTLKAQGVTPIPGLDSSSYFDTVKIRKPAVSIESTGIGSLSFDYANEAYIRTFPNDGGQGIFEFQAGNWTDSDRKFIKRGPVDIRKASATELGPTSVLNMEEGDARWGGGSADYIGITTRKYDASAPNISTGTYPEGTAIGIGPNVKLTDNNTIAVGAAINAQTNNMLRFATMLGYQLVASGATTTRMIALGGYVEGYGYIHVENGAVCIGYSNHETCAKEGSVVIGDNAQARDRFTVAVGSEAIASGMCSLAFGRESYTNAAYDVAVGASAEADGIHATAIGGQAIAKGNNAVGIGGKADVCGQGSIGIGFNATIGTSSTNKQKDGSIAIGAETSCGTDQSVVVGGWTIVGSSDSGQVTALGYSIKVDSSSPNVVAVGANVSTYGSKNGIAVGVNSSITGDNSIAIGHSASSMHGGLAIGPKAKINYAGVLISNMADGITLTGDSASDTSLSFRAAAKGYASNSIIFELNSKFDTDQSKAVYFKSLSDEMSGEVEGYCSRNNFARLLNNARLGNYPSQPFVEVTPLYIDKLYELQPNTIYHVTIAPTIEPEPLDLSRLAFAFDIAGIPTAELHIVTNATKAISNIIWPDNMIWPDETDQSVAPAIATPTDKTRCYVFTVRRQIINAAEYFIGSLAYSVDVSN